MHIKQGKMVVQPRDKSLTLVNRVQVSPYADIETCRPEGLSPHLTVFFTVFWFLLGLVLVKADRQKEQFVLWTILPVLVASLSDLYRFWADYWCLMILCSTVMMIDGFSESLFAD